MSRHPPVKWAQRSDKIYITIELPDAENVKLKLDPDGKFFFSATSGADRIPYEIEFNLFDQVDVNESKAHVGSRNILYLVKKAESKWWSRLLKQEGKSPIFLKVDWDKWVDEDDKSGAGFDDFDFSKMNMGGGGADFDTDEIGEDDEGTETSDDEIAGATDASAVGGHEKNVGAEESSADGKHETEAKV